MSALRPKLRHPLIKKSDFYLIPNILTVARVFAVPFVAVAAYWEWNWAAAGLFGLCGISDYIDGLIARKYGYESKLGMLLDPLADKLIIVSTMVMLLWLGRLDVNFRGQSYEILPPFLVIITVGREIGITGLRAIASTAGIVIPAERGGKLKTWIQFFAILFLLINHPTLVSIGQGLLFISVITAVWSGIQYILRFVRRLPS